MEFDVRDTRNKNWLWIRREMLRQHGDTLGMRGVSVYAALASFADEDNTAYPSLGTLAEMLDISRPTVRKAIQDLQRLGWVGYEERSTEEHGDTSHLFYLLSCPVENDLGGGEKSVSTASQADCHEVEGNKVEGNEESARVKDRDNEGVEVWVDVTGERPTIQTQLELKQYFEHEAPRWDPEAFRSVLREAFVNVDRDAHRIKLGYLESAYEKELEHDTNMAVTEDGKLKGSPEPGAEYNARGYRIN